MYSFKKIAVIAFVCSSIFLLESCDPNRVFDENKSIDKDQWDYTDVKKFELTVEDTSSHYNVAINVRHSFLFDWRNMYVFVTTTFPDSTTIEKRVNLPLSEPNGEWYGNCMGDNCYLTIPIQQNALFPQKGKYQFSIRQDMRTSPLPNIKYIGLRVEKNVSSKTP